MRRSLPRSHQAELGRSSEVEVEYSSTNVLYHLMQI